MMTFAQAGMTPWFAVALGGAGGACLRFAVSLWVGVPAMPAWPWATFLVNLVGGFLFGLLAVLLAASHVNEVWRLALTTGLLGALTTFSTFSFELVRMIEARAWLLAGGYALASVLACASLAGLGLALGRMVFE